MKQRIAYIDALKGFIIILVVLAHVIAWSYTDLDGFQSDIAMSWLFQLIYAFHMPLFFFVSGMLAYRSLAHSTLTDIVRKRTMQLLLPYIAATLFVTFILRQEMNYWFLIALYSMHLVTGLSIRFHVHPLILWAVIYGASMAFPQINDIPYLFIPSFKMHYLSFLLGFYLSKHPVWLERMQRNCYPYMLIAFLAVFALPFAFPVIDKYLQLGGVNVMFRFLRSTPMVLFFLFWFKENAEFVCKGRWLPYVGTQTLIIYIVHVFFKFTVPKWGDMLALQMSCPSLMQILYATVITVLLVAISLICGRIIERDCVLSSFFLGKYKK